MTEEEAFMRAFCVRRKARGVSGAASSHCGKMETAGQRSNTGNTENQGPGVRVYLKYLFYLSFLFPLLLFESISTNHAIIEYLKVASCPNNLITD